MIKLTLLSLTTNMYSNNIVPLCPRILHQERGVLHWCIHLHLLLTPILTISIYLFSYTYRLEWTPKEYSYTSNVLFSREYAFNTNSNHIVWLITFSWPYIRYLYKYMRVYCTWGWAWFSTPWNYGKVKYNCYDM